MSQKSHENQQQEQQIQQSTSLWSQMAGQVLESLTDKNMTATMDLQNIEIDVPKARGPGGRDSRQRQMDSKWKDCMDYRTT